MAKYLLLKHYRGAPSPVNDISMDRWTPEEVTAHIQYMRDFAAKLEETGEFVYNMATYDLREAVNASSAEYGPAISEPDRIGLEMAPCREVKPPRVARSPVALECKYYKTVELVSSDGTRNTSSVILGEVVGIHIDDGFINRVRDKITPGTSALFILSSDAVVDKIRDAFAGQETPELVFTNLSTEQEAALREVFGEERQTAEEAS